MVDVKKVAQAVDEIAPFSLAMEWDNVGVLLDCGNETNGVLFALDVTPETLSEAKMLDCGILVTHHPVLVEPQKTFGARDMIVQAAKMNISLIAAHTCFDIADGGVNDTLCALLGLRDTQPLGVLGRGGKIDPLPEQEFVRYVQERLLGGDPVSVVSAGKQVERVAVAGGSAGDYALIAADAGYDALVTGELKHSAALAAKAAGICVVCAGHFRTENPAMERLCCGVAAQIGPHAKCVLSREGADPFKLYR